MAFTGVPVVKLVSDNLVRITGVSLAANEDGAIANSQGGAGVGVVFVQTPAGFKPAPYKRPDDDAIVGIVDSLQAWWVPVAGGETLMPTVIITKTEGPDGEFGVFFENLDESAGPEMEIYLRFH